jgi:hypothetical protein
MARTTIAAVRALLASQNVNRDDVDLASFIATAGLMVDGHLLGRGISELLLAEIEKYLAAHVTVLAGITAGVSSQSADDASITYTAGQLNTAQLENSHFGQVAITLDVSGTLARTGRQRASFQVL